MISLIGEVVSASILLGAMAVVAVIILGVIGEQSQVVTDDIRSRMDIMRAQAVEQLDITGTSWSGSGGIPGNYSFLVSNYGDYKTTIPFAVYAINGTDVTTHDIHYIQMNGTPLVSCEPSCNLYKKDLAPKGVIRVVVESWPGVSSANPLIIVTDTGRALRVGD